MARGHAKGSAFERLMCRTLSEWISQGQRSDVFWRSSQSGGRAKIRGRKGLQTFGQHGDITALHPIGIPFLQKVTVELKNGYSKLSIQDLIDRSKAKLHQIEEWFEQVGESQTQGEADHWMLIWKRNASSPLLFTDHRVYDYLGPKNSLTLELSHSSPVYIFPLRDLLDTDPVLFQKRCLGIK